MNSYTNYTDEDLIEAYASMLEYSGKPNDELLQAIDQRGGMDRFLKLIEQKTRFKAEVDRISTEVSTLSSREMDIDFVKTFISSDMLSKEELDALVEQRFWEKQARLKDEMVNTNIIFRSLVGTLVGTLVGAVLWGLSLYYFNNNYNFLLVGVFFISYGIMRMFTGKTSNNTAVFLGSFFATFCAALLGYYFAYLFSGF